ncbi:MAG: hypothetical protein OEW05_12035 [Candidatus Aminicenantes bacterium]|nr:hypothetical protein [Candidatus Aminicenantes bacterium]
MGESKRLSVILAAVAAVLALAGPAAADWKQDIQAYLGTPKDYPGAFSFLQGAYPGLDAGDKQTAVAFLAYLASKVPDEAEEKRWLVDYFEFYRDADPLLDFLDFASRQDFFDYWGRWQRSYPIITDLNLLEPAGAPVLAAPSEIRVGVELLNSAFYKISDSTGTLAGGLWQGGFHILSLPASGMFDESGSREFILDLKAGDIIVRKRIVVEVDVRRPTPPAGPASGNVLRAKELKGEVALYVGDKLISSSRKIMAKTPPLDVPIPGPSAPDTKPYLVPRKDVPTFTGVSIFEAVGAAYSVLRDLLKKKPLPPSPPSYQKVKRMTVTYSTQEVDAGAQDIQAHLTLRPGGAEILVP